MPRGEKGEKAVSFSMGTEPLSEDERTGKKSIRSSGEEKRKISTMLWQKECAATAARKKRKKKE